jgi:hypothetical protein
VSIEAMGVVWRAKITDAAGRPDHSKKLVLLRFADHSNKQGVCWPGLDDVAAYTQVSVRQVQRDVKESIARGWLEIVEQGYRAGRGRIARAPRYKIRLDRIAALPQVEDPEDGRDSMASPSMAATGGADGRATAVSPEPSVEPPELQEPSVRRGAEPVENVDNRSAGGRRDAALRAAREYIGPEAWALADFGTERHGWARTAPRRRIEARYFQQLLDAGFPEGALRAEVTDRRKLPTAEWLHRYLDYGRVAAVADDARRRELVAEIVARHWPGEAS